MEKYQHPSHNHVFGAPSGWDQGGLPCGALSVRRDRLAGHPVIVSHWRPTPDEIEALVAGNVVALRIVGEGMPPVSLCVESAT